jgi:hypothetical protein
VPKAVFRQSDKRPIFNYLQQKQLLLACSALWSLVEAGRFQKLQNYLQCAGNALNQQLAHLLRWPRKFTARHCHETGSPVPPPRFFSFQQQGASDSLKSVARWLKSDALANYKNLAPRPRSRESGSLTTHNNKPCRDYVGSSAAGLIAWNACAALPNT